VAPIGAPDLKRFYEEAYSGPPEEGKRYARWRELGARAKADHVQELCARIGLEPRSVVEVGCGDGALLAELRSRGLGEELAGYEISESAVAIARGRGIRAESFDGARLPLSDDAFDLGVLSHVLEHVEEPAALLAETARVSRAVILEVPLEANVSARRGSKREGAVEIGHLQRLDRRAARRIVHEAGLEVAAELTDPLTREVHAFFADSAPARVSAAAKAALRRAAYGASRRAAERLFTVHYACACVSPGFRRK
jgi:SAM-dependent methyltransferase